MRRIVIAFVAILFMGISMFAKNDENQQHINDMIGIINHLESVPGVSITYLTESSLKRLSKIKSNSPLALILKEDGVNSVRVFEFETPDAQKAGNQFLNVYKGQNADMELFHLQRDNSKEIMIYAIPDHRIKTILNYYSTILMYSKTQGAKSILIIISGRVEESTIGNIIAAFSE